MLIILSIASLITLCFCIALAQDSFTNWASTLTGHHDIKVNAVYYP